MGEPNNMSEKSYYRQTAEAVLAELRSSEKGISAKEAAARLEQEGPNKLDEVNRESLPRKYFRQWKDAMIILLVASSLLSWMLSEGRTAFVLFLLAILNTAIGFFQEYKAERIMDSLRRLVVPDAQVVRDGQSMEIPSTELVVGDVVYIEEGDSVPADLRLIQTTELSTNDFALTGESQPTHKFVRPIESEVPVGNRHNIVFMGTTVATGTAYGVVIGTGMQTELGRIARLSQAA